MGIFQDLVNLPRGLKEDLRMNKTQALVVVTCFWCWTVGSMHFYLLPYTQPDLAVALHVSQSQIAYANTTSMLSRSIGAVIFGIMADQLGRKWPMVLCLCFMMLFTFLSGAVQTYGGLLAVRFFYGVTYGGLYGINMAAVLEAVPRPSRGIIAAIVQQGFSAGNLLASGFRLAMSPYSLASYYYLGGGITVSAIILRIITPSYSVTAQAVRENEGIQEVSERAAVGGNLSFWKKLRYALNKHWPIFVYCTVLTTGYNTLGHGHLDVFPSFLKSQRHIPVLESTWITIILQCGGITGGILGGYMTKLSIRWVPLVWALFCGPFLPLLVLPTSWNLLALGGFCFEFCYGASIGALGNIFQLVCPHPGIRGLFTGLTYNLGNAVSSIAPSIETKLGEAFALPDGSPDYARTIICLSAIVIFCLVVTLACMPIKNVNMEWDAEDPNEIIPAHEQQAKATSPQPHHNGEPKDLERPDSGNRQATPREVKEADVSTKEATS